MALLIELAQFAITLAISGVVAMLLGSVYAAVVVLVTATCTVLLLDAARRYSEIAEEPITIRSYAMLIGTAVVFGLIWPAIPLIFTWRRGVLDDA